MSPAAEKRIGVYVCYCGGNISDYVDVAQVAQAVSQEAGVVVSRNHMFTCSDSAQQEIIQDMHEQKLDGLVIASCSPKLHMYTFRAMAERGGVNPYQYVQVNLREQCSWAHNHDKPSATRKGIALVRAGIAKARGMLALTPLRVTTRPEVLVVGGGMAGMKAALALSDMGLAVNLVEKEATLGGWTAQWGQLAPTGQDGKQLAGELAETLRQRANVRLHLSSELVGKSGNLGDFTFRVNTPSGEQDIRAGAVVVATGFEPYAPLAGEFGSGLPNVITLPELKKQLAAGLPLRTQAGEAVKSLVYIYCVGSRQKARDGGPKPNTHCSRYCCTSATYASLSVQSLQPGVAQYHLFRDLRTYGAHERLYEQARNAGAVYVRFDQEEPPQVSAEGRRLLVKVKDPLTHGEALEIPADLVVLVTGMLPRPNERLLDVLKVPVDANGFLKEIHPKLRPVETVMDGFFIAGTAQSPRLLGEAVASALAAVSKTGALLKKGYVDLEPLIAEVKIDRCTWCGKCLEVCPYRAIEQVDCDGQAKAAVLPFLCKGCGACVPVCPTDALDVKGYEQQQMLEAITALAQPEEAAV
jgi:heterodisulfide reductase subunit A2